MPYKREGTKVLVRKAGRWVLLKNHPTVMKAMAHLAALNINVHHK